MASCALADLDAWLQTIHQPRGYAGPVAHWWQNRYRYTGPGLDWRYEGILIGYSLLYQKTGELRWRGHPDEEERDPFGGAGHRDGIGGHALDGRTLVVTVGDRVVELEAETGDVIASGGGPAPAGGGPPRGGPAGTVRNSFLLEAGYVTVAGIVMGASLSLVTAYRVVVDAAAFGDFDAGFTIPWPALAALAAGALLAALAATAVPARRAARIHPAVALRVAD
jgi:hypothetical protein